MRKNFNKTIAGLLALGIFLAPVSSFASEDSVFEILDSGAASEKTYEGQALDDKENTSENREPKKEASSEVSYEADSLEEALFDLYVKIETARQTQKIDVTDYVRLINLRNADLAHINEARASLETLLAETGENIALDLDKETVKAEISDLVNYGRVVFSNLLNKESLDDLHVAYEAVINSKAYKNSTGDAKAAYDKVLTGAYGLIKDLDKKADLSGEDRAKISSYVSKLAELAKNAKDHKAQNKKADEKNLVTESKTLKNKNYLSNANTLDVEEDKVDEDSPFYKNESTREAYKALSAEERKKLDEINTTKDDVITKEELDADGNYTAESPWLKPFLAKIEGSSESTDTTSTGTSTTSTSTTSISPSTSTTTTTTPSNPAGGTPETVTISSTSNPTEKEDGDVKTNTYSSQNAKTGIEGIGYLGIVLIVALAAYFVLLKKKKEEDE